MDREQTKGEIKVSNNRNISQGGLISQMLMNTSLMQKRVNEHQAIFGSTIQKQENKTGLPDNLKTGMETLSGMSLDHVKVHYNSSKPASVQAHAYASNNNIHIASGQEKHLPHELGHIVQQAEGGVKPTANIGGVAVNDNPTLEREATKMGKKALQMKSINNFVMSNFKDKLNKPLQFASEYDGLLPSHESWGDNYKDSQNTNSTDFTYHHIIPENKLKNVAKEFIKIKDNIDDYTNSKDIKNSYNENINTLKDNAKGVWLNTRVQDFIYNFNKNFQTDGITINKGEITNILQNNNEHKQIYKALEKLILTQTKSQVETNFYQRKQLLASVTDTLSKQIKENLKNINNIDNYTFDMSPLNKLTDIIDDKEASINKIKNDWANAQSKAEIRNAIKKNVRSREFKDYYQYKCKTLNTKEYFGNDGLTTALSENNFGDGSLNKIIRSYALPHDDDNDFYLKSAVQWNPGNIHRGPASSKRRNPKDNQFNELLDDGGDDFEKAAVQILVTDHFRELNKLNQDIDTFLANKNKDEAKIVSATNLVKDMQKIQNRGLTKFDKNQWQFIGNGKMQLKGDKIKNQTQYNNLLKPQPQIPLNNVNNSSSSITKKVVGTVATILIVGGGITAGLSYFGLI